MPPKRAGLGAGENSRMGNWYKVTVPASEAGLLGNGKRVQDAFVVVFMSAKSTHNAAMFGRPSDDFDTYDFFFSPDAWNLAGPLLESYSAVKCERPLNDGRIRLRVGHHDAATLLAVAGGR
jgi:hypothetical protein